MAEKIKIFVSYKWSVEYDLPSILEDALRVDSNLELIYDKKIISVTDPIHNKISESIDTCDCLLTSRESFESFEVTSEIVRAHERGKLIILLNDARKKTMDIPAYLYFLHDKLQITYSNIENLKISLLGFFKGKAKKDFIVIPSSLRKIIQEIGDLSKIQPYRAYLMEKIIQDAFEEIKEVKDKEYKIDVGFERNFLLRAEAIFSSAKEVFAVSIDKVSTFWTNDHNKKRAVEYIDNQPNTTQRLFVFSTPRSANLHKYILQKNYNVYGEKGGVYICSYKSYKLFLEKISSNHSLENKDFALLKYDNEHHVEAILNNSELIFKQISLKGHKEVNYSLMIDYWC